MSTARSVTTVPRALEKGVPSSRVNTPHRRNSPERGTTRLDAYDRKMACMQLLTRGRSPNGSSDCRQRRARNTWANTPGTNDRIIHSHRIWWSITSRISLKSMSLYIQYRMPPPSTKGKMILSVF